MIKLQNLELDEFSLNTLKKYQKEIDDLETFELKSKKAKEIFPNKNKIGNITFDKVKEKLTEMCSGSRRCVYCEDSVGDEVEHIQPKDLYPEKCFDWNNYVYACGNCNGPKNNKYAVFMDEDNVFQIVNPPKGTSATKPPNGISAFINPRNEDPLSFCILDLSSTFNFVVIKPADSVEAKKADYTYNEVLKLNQREFLRKARETAYYNYKSRLGYYTSEKEKGVSNIKLNKLIENLKKEAHPTVWKEMQRQHHNGFIKKFDLDLDNLFLNSPEALNW